MTFLKKINSRTDLKNHHSFKNVISKRQNNFFEPQFQITSSFQKIGKSIKYVRILSKKLFAAIILKSLFIFDAVSNFLKLWSTDIFIG